MFWFPFWFPFDFFTGTPQEFGQYVRHILVPLCLVVLMFTTVYAKAGHSRWWGFFALIPIAWPVLALFIVFSHWPVLKEVSRLRLLDGSAKDKDAYEVLDQADKLFKNGRFKDGEELCQRVATAFGDTDPGRNAKILLEDAMTKVDSSVHE
jgi:hypothetical protein